MSWEQALAALVERRTGIRLEPRQIRLDVRRKIDEQVRSRSLAGPADWVASLERSQPDNPEFRWLIHAVTVGYSYFFRDADQLAAAVGVLEDLDRGRRGRSHLHVWCAGCSTGQEPWSLAVLAARARLPVQILATDLNPDFLEIAAKGHYPSKASDQIPPDLRSGFVPVEDGFSIAPELRPAVQFRPHNLAAAAPYPVARDGGAFDLILCRNVFIYFSDEVRTGVADRFARALQPNGWLFLGPGETLDGTTDNLVACAWGRRVGYCPPGSTGSLLPGQPPPIDLGTDGPDPLVEALRLVAADQLDRAEAVLLRAATQQGRAGLWLALAHLRIKRHDFPRALEACASALAANPLLAEAHTSTGLIHRKLGDSAAAERTFRRALFLDPDAWRAGLLLAGVYGRQGRDQERDRALRQVRDALRRLNGESRPSAPSFGVDALEGGPERAVAALARIQPR